jgi:hypothetical protein
MSRVLKRREGSPPILEEVEVNETQTISPRSIAEALDEPPHLEKIKERIDVLDIGVDLNEGEPISRSELKLPPVPGPYLNWEQWSKYASTLTKDHWSHVDCYLYRYFPIIDQDPKYIDCFGQWQEFNYYVERHGGGKYGLSVCDRALSKHQQQICSVRFEVDWHKFPPLLNYTTLELGDKRNRAYINKLINQGILTPDMEIVPMQPRGNPDQTELVNKLTDKVIDLASSNNRENNRPRESGVENQAASAAIKMVSDVSQKLMEQQIANSNPLAQIEALAKLANLGKGDNGALEVMKLMMEMQKEANATLRESIKATNERMEKLIEKISESHQNNGNNPGTLLDSLETMMSITERLGGASKEPSLVNSLIGLGEKVLPHFMGPLAQFVISKQGSPLPIQNPPALPPGSPNIVSMPSPNEGTQPMPESQPNVTKEQVAQFISQFGPRITTAMEKGDSGADIAQSLETLMGYDTYLQIRAVMEDKNLVMEGAQMVPQFWTLIKGHGIPKFEEFIDSFCEWATIREQPETDGEVS